MAKGFKFKLQSVLDLKFDIEEEEKRKLADVMQLQEREEQKLMSMQARQAQLIAELKKKQGEGAINITELQMYSRGIEKLKNDIIGQLRSELLYARGQASQDVQTAAIQAGQRALANEVEQYVLPTPRPAYIVQNPNCCQQFGACTCGA